MGGTLAAPTVAGLLQGCTAQPDLTWTPIFFSEDQARTITVIADIILPKTDTPGASELGVPKFIEDIIGVVSGNEERTKFMEQLADWDRECQSQTGSSFNDLSSEKQVDFVSSQHDKIKGQSIRPDERPFIWNIKELVISGYFTTEVGMTKILQYVAIPTRYDACIPLEEAGGRTWAT